MQEKNLRLLKDAAYAVGAPLDDKEVCRLAQFCDLVLDANRLFNLTAITNEEEFAVKHIADSLSALPYLGRGKLADVGAGAGFPSMPIAIAREDIEVVAIDSTLKKVNFLAGAAKTLGVSNLTAIAARAEEATDLFSSFDFATARAVAPLNVLLEIVSPLLKVGGVFIAYKASECEVESAKNASKVLNMRYDGAKCFSLSDGSERALLLFTKTAATPKGYPRKYSAIKKRPL